MAKGAKPGERRGGRSKGTPNKDSVSVREYLQSVDCNPVEILAKIASGEELECRISFNEETGDFIEGAQKPTFDQRMTAAKTLLEYCAPKLKSIEHAPALGAKSFTLTISTGDER